MKKKLLITTILASMAAAPAYAGGDSPEYQEGYKAGLAAAKNSGGKSGGPTNSLADAFTNGKAYIDARYRYEKVNDDGFALDAKASTLRTNLGFKTASFKGVQGLLELENISELGRNDFNNGVNGKTTYPAVTDVEGTELNQAWLSYSGIQDTVVKAGRERIVLDNARFIGDVGWRQNNQTFDGFNVINKSIPDTSVMYGYISNVNRIFGNDNAAGDFNSQSHIVNAKYTGIKAANITGYWYGLDFDNSAANSSSTLGARVDGGTEVGSGVKALYDLEYARQSDYKDNTNNYTADYYRIEPGVAWNGLTVKAGYEVLGADVTGDAGRVFRTPLATGHKWNGWADKFAAIPAGGLQDTYGLVSYKVGGVHEYFDGTTLTAVYHDFSQDEGSADYGREWDFNIAQTVMENYTVGVKLANYDADANAPAGTLANDTQKVIFTLGVKFSQ